MRAIELPARCDRAAADALLPELVAAQGEDRIAVDGRNVQQIGQSVLQLLLSARQSGNGATIMPSAALAEAARMTGLTAELFDEGQP